MLSVLIPIVFAATLPAPDVCWIDLRANVEVDGFVVTLSDVAAVDAVDAATKARVERLELGRFEGGRTRLVLDRATIERLLVAHGVRGTVFAGAERVVVRPRLVSIGLDRIRNAVERHVRGVLGERAGLQRVELGPYVQPLEVPKARFRIELRVERDPKNRVYAGLLNLPVVVEVDGAPLLRQVVPVSVSRRVEVVVVTRRVNRGRPIEAADLSLEEREVTRLGAAPLRTVEEALGQLARNGLVPGQILLARDLKALPVVRKGDLVTVEIGVGGIRARTLCKARQDGAPGERIVLENVESKRTVYAVVKDSRTARVVLP